ncbi:hypothetical protein B0H17DRAFT_673602 [Mycena rosella]|uniref:Uncharacterized protein n=1 Tax=Mycena rosella TaxID=1033263 RepID=A0AAD7GHE4_MYCRO|nr:hypothetical protein B0H17DRAFT_673602 [Mycena rosella]
MGKPWHSVRLPVYWFSFLLCSSLHSLTFDPRRTPIHLLPPRPLHPFTSSAVSPHIPHHRRHALLFLLHPARPCSSLHSGRAASSLRVVTPIAPFTHPRPRVLARFSSSPNPPCPRPCPPLLHVTSDVHIANKHSPPHPSFVFPPPCLRVLAPHPVRRLITASHPFLTSPSPPSQADARCSTHIVPLSLSFAPTPPHIRSYVLRLTLFPARLIAGSFRVPHSFPFFLFLYPFFVSLRCS